MKIRSNLVLLFSIALLMAACDKKEDVVTEPTKPVQVNHERDIFYTVASNGAFSGFSANTIHLSSDDEWDNLLEQFCNYAQEGEQVTFRNAIPHSQPKLQKASKDAPTTITTTSRAEIKAWMKEMEMAGKTVNVTFDSDTGTWTGRAYDSVAPPTVDTEVRDITGTIVFLPTPAVQNPPVGGIVMALRVNANEVYILVMQGMLLWFGDDTPSEDLALIEGSEATFRGATGVCTDLNNNDFQILDLEMTDNVIISF